MRNRYLDCTTTSAEWSRLLGCPLSWVPLASEMQFNKVPGLIEAGIREGARVVAGGLGRPQEWQRGLEVKAVSAWKETAG